MGKAKHRQSEKVVQQDDYVDRDLPVQDLSVVPVEPSAKKGVPKHRQCPICYSGWGGVGKAYRTARTRRYYRCQTCGHTFKYDFVRNTIEFIDDEE